MSAGLELATLRYNSALPEHSWLRQIMDMFNVEVSQHFFFVGTETFFYFEILSELKLNDLISLIFVHCIGLSDPRIYTINKYHGNAFTFVELFG